MGNAHPNIVPYQVFEAADGPLVIACGNDGQFARLCDGLGLALHRDPRFRTQPRPARAPGRRCVAALEARIAAMPRAEVLAAMDGGRRPGGADQQRRRGLRRAAGASRAGMVQEIGGLAQRRGSPIRFSAAELAADRPPPRLDEHGAAIRAALAEGAGWP